MTKVGSAKRDVPIRPLEPAVPSSQPVCHRFRTKSRRLPMPAWTASKAARLLLAPFLAWAAASHSPAHAEPGLAHEVVGGSSEYVVRKGDSLTAIGARFGESVADIARRNGLEPRHALQPGQRIQIDNRHIVPETLDDGVLINLPQRMLFFFRDGKLSGAYPVGLGKPSWPTPAGNFKVVALRKDPTWHVPLSIQEEMRREGKAVLTRVAPGPDNPLGRYWIGLSMAGYGIHGTSAPPSVYHFQSHGCIRLHPDDVESLFADMQIGTTGKIIYAPLLLAELPDGHIELEVNPDIYRKQPDPWDTLVRLAAQNGLTDRIDWQKARRVVKQQEGLARRIDRQAEVQAPAP
ncbi:MAG: L,D-transpeptidase family protein [Thiomonas sp.]|uniref:Putative ErfK/YbiS/YcfS/YnhG family protein n=1 Tax=mine drainage metagenome TaxID=410659 RepID=E6PT60_9ZZZZ